MHMTSIAVVADPDCQVSDPGFQTAHRARRPVDRAAVARATRDLQLQERLNVQIAGWLQQHLQLERLGVVLEAEHLCMSMRGCRSRARGLLPWRCTGSCATTRARARSS
jgi:GTP cyclohydrolase I